MKRRLFATLALILAMVSLVPPETAQAHATSSISYFRGLTAVAGFSNTDPDGCATTAFVFTTESKSFDSSGRTSASSATVTISRFGNCAGAVGLFDGTTTPLPSTALRIDSFLKSATLNTTVNVCSPDPTAGCFDVAVALRWAGNRALVFQSTHDFSRVPGCRTYTLSLGLSRQAVAYGTISDGTTNFAAGQSTDGDLELAVNGQLVKGCEGHDD